MIFENRKNNSDLSVPYTYMLYFNLDGVIHFYYGVRYGNVRLSLSPEQDLFKKYFTSSKCVKALLEKGILPYKIVIHKTFTSHIDACKYEVNFLTRLNAKKRKDFLNLTTTFDNSLPNNLGRVMSDENKKKISKGLKKAQSSEEYRKNRSELLKKKWSDPEFRNKMNARNAEYRESGKSKEAGAKSGNSRIGLKYSEEVKSKRSEALKRACEKIDMKSRAINRKRYVCPICNLSNLDGGNFNSHVISKHEWTKAQSSIFKSLN